MEIGTINFDISFWSGPCAEDSVKNLAQNLEWLVLELSKFLSLISGEALSSWNPIICKNGKIETVIFLKVYNDKNLKFSRVTQIWEIKQWVEFHHIWWHHGLKIHPNLRGYPLPVGFPLITQKKVKAVNLTFYSIN